MEGLRRVRLSDPEIEAGLKTLSGWAVRDGKLEKTYSFGAYLDGPDFAHDVGVIAEEMDHHPDILISWRKATVSVNTHDVGGISPFDFELARRIDALSP